MPSPEETQAGERPRANPPDDDVVVIHEESAGKEPGPGAPAADREPGPARPAGAGGPGFGPPGAGTPAGSRPPTAAGEAVAAPAMAARDSWTAWSAADRGPRTGPPPPGADRRWREIQAMFVDDPRDSVQRAADLIDTVIEEFVASVHRRRAALASSWQDHDTDTEALRVTLKDYRAFWTVMRDMPTAVAAAEPGD